MNSILWLSDNIHHSKNDCVKLGYRPDNISFFDIRKTAPLDYPFNDISLLIVHITNESVSNENLSILSEFFEDLPSNSHCIVLVPISFPFAPIKSNNAELIQTAIMYENITIIAHSKLIEHPQTEGQFDQHDRKLDKSYVQAITFHALRMLIDCVNDNNYGHKILYAVGKNHITLSQKSLLNYFFSRNKFDPSLRKYTTPRKVESTIIDGLIDQKVSLKSSKSLPMEVQ